MLPQTSASCGRCGAALPAGPGDAPPACPNCGEVGRPAAGRGRPDFGFVIPIPDGVDGWLLRDRARRLLVAEAKDPPEDVLEAGRLVEEGFGFAPVWWGEGGYETNWTADFGFKRDEAPEDPAAGGRAGGAAGAREKDSGKFVVWREAGGSVSGGFSTLVHAGDDRPFAPGGDETQREFIEGLEARSPLERAEPFDEALLRGLAPMEAVTDRADDAARLIEAKVARRSEEKIAKDEARGLEQKNWAMRTRVSLDRPPSLGLAPFAKAVYEYGGERYNLWFEGAGLDDAWHRGLPEDRARGRRIKRGFWPFWAALILGVLCVAWSLAAGAGIRPFSLAALLAAAGLHVAARVRAERLRRRSKKVLEAGLARLGLAEAEETGRPLAEEELPRLREEGRAPANPWWLRPASDVPLIAAGAVVAALLASFGIIGGHPRVAARDGGSSEVAGGVAAVAADAPQAASSDDLSATLQAMGRELAEREAAARPSGSAAAPAERPAPAPVSEADDPPPRVPTPPPPPNLRPVSRESLACDASVCNDGRGNPFTGMVYETREGDPSLPASMTYYRRGVPATLAVHFDSDLNVVRARSLRRGRPHGLTVSFHASSDPSAVSELVVMAEGKRKGPSFGFDGDGRVIRHGTFEDDLEQGDWYEYHPDGGVASVTSYERGEVKLRRSFRPGERTGRPPAFEDQERLNRLLINVRAMRDWALQVKWGPVASPVPRGRLVCDASVCRDGRGRPFDGLVYEAGDGDPSSPSSMAAYRRGVPDGTEAYFDRNLIIVRTRFFCGGRPDGLAVWMHEPPDSSSAPEEEPLTIFEVKVMADGKRDGPAFVYDRNGEVIRYGRYVDDREQGDWYEYYPAGGVKSVRSYERGVVKSRRSFRPGEMTAPPPAFERQADLDRLLDDAWALRGWALEVRGGR